MSIPSFTTEEACFEFLERRIWNGNPICPHCGSQRIYRLANGKQFKCGNKKSCDRKFTILACTIFENTKIPLVTWFAAIYLLCSYKRGISSYQLAGKLGVTQKTAWFVVLRLRKIKGLNQYIEEGVILKK